MASPVFTNNEAFQKDYRPSFNAGTEAMTYEGTVVKAIMSFVAVLVGAGIGIFVLLPFITQAIYYGLIGATVVFALVIAFKRITNPVALVSYAALQGVITGLFSLNLELQYPGIVIQALLATTSVFVVVMFLSHTKVFRTTPRLNKIFGVAFAGYILFSLLNLVLSATGLTDGAFGIRSDLGIFGIAIGVLGALLASYSLVMDYEFIENGVRNQAPKRMEWVGAFGITITFVWLYIEILRLLAMFRR
jgi:uncharacterized YccA/Bax inhibitor family protein